MLVWQAINARVSSKEFERDLDIRLPWALKTDPISTRGILFHRIRMSRARPAGSRAAVLDGQRGPTITRSGRQRVVVRGLVSFHAGSGWLRVKALKAHIRYLGRSSARYHGDRPMFFDGQSDEVDALSRANEWRNDRRHFRFVISPEHGDRIADMRDYVRILFARVAGDLGEPELDWFAICHFDTSHPHSHVVLRGEPSDGRSVALRAFFAANAARSLAPGSETSGSLSPRLNPEESQ